jgi:hypothetical protein
MLRHLTEKNANSERIAEKALEDEKVFSELLEGVVSKENTIRYTSFKTLLLLTEEHPQVLGSKWDFFVDLLRSHNTYHTGRVRSTS